MKQSLSNVKDNLAYDIKEMIKKALDEVHQVAWDEGYEEGYQEAVRDSPTQREG